MRVGIGYDIHRFAAPDLERDLLLCGVRFEACNGLDGHSDADVVLHAVMDAILGAAALGDIGDHFPPSDDAWRDANSGNLLGAVLGLIEGRFRVHNVDVTVVAEYPKIGPRRAEMRATLSKLLDVEISSVSIKATTNEMLGPVGRNEGIAAFSVVLLEENA